MHGHKQAGAQIFDEAPQVVGVGVAAGVALEELAVSRLDRGNQRLEARLSQIARPIRKDAGGAMRKARRVSQCKSPRSGGSRDEQ